MLNPAIKDLPVQLRKIMRTDVVTIDSTETASAASSKMKRRRIRHLVVTHNAGIAGILSECDLRRPEGRDRHVRDLMTSDVVSAGQETELTEAAELMLKHRIGCLPFCKTASWWVS